MIMKNEFTITCRSPIAVSLTSSWLGNFSKRNSISIPNCKTQRKNLEVLCHQWNNVGERPILVIYSYSSEVFKQHVKTTLVKIIIIIKGFGHNLYKL